MEFSVPSLEYPRRPSFFAYRLTRMMFKTALANEIGPEACHLIIQIAHTEDATRYSKAVTFYNEQLLPVCGFANAKSLDRARAKAVKSGWLVYIPGGKSKAGKYWTVIPPQHIHLDDSPIDESNSTTELSPPKDDAPYVPVAGKETPDIRQINGRETPDKRQTNARQTPDKRATITSIPIPNTNPESAPENSDHDFSRVVNPVATLITLPGGSKLDYHDDPMVWQAEFIRQWNQLPGVNQHIRSCLTQPNLRLLFRNLQDPDWDWSAAFREFPVWQPGDSRAAMSWFLEDGIVNKIIEGRFKLRSASPRSPPPAVDDFVSFTEEELEDK